MFYFPQIVGVLGSVTCGLEPPLGAFCSDRGHTGRFEHLCVPAMSRVVLASCMTACVFFGGPAIAQPRSSSQVLVFSTHFEANGMRFESLEELRDYLLDAPKDFYSILIRDCAVKGREREIRNVVFGALVERRARRGEDGPAFLGVGSIPCP